MNVPQTVYLYFKCKKHKLNNFGEKKYVLSCYFIPNRNMTILKVQTEMTMIGTNSMYETRFVENPPSIKEYFDENNMYLKQRVDELHRHEENKEKTAEEQLEKKIELKETTISSGDVIPHQ